MRNNVEMSSVYRIARAATILFCCVGMYFGVQYRIAEYRAAQAAGVVE